VTHVSHDAFADPPRPTVNVLLASLGLVGLYLIITIVATLALAAAQMGLHPATRWFIWLVLTTAVGFNLLRRHRRYPSPAVLALILALSIGILLAMSVAAVRRLAAGSSELGPQLLSFAANAAGLFVVGAAGLYLAQRLFNRRARSR
jgi:FtsH-binding integral membrane protein